MVVRRGIFLGLVLTVAATMGAVGFAKDKTADQEPFAWGMQSGNDGCVIFRESEEQTSVNEGGTYKSYTVKQLEVVDAMKATLPQKKYSETKENLDALQALSMENHLKYVKIPKKYSAEQLEKAKALCGVQ
jgi:hypothetical protein